MIRDLLIGELADMFHITASQIRYYEKEGLLTSYKDYENGYHYYGFDEMQRLEVILLLREIGTSIKDIKEVVGKLDRDQYRDSLKASVKEIDRDILNLKRKKKKLVDRIKRMDSVDIEKFRIQYQQKIKVYMVDLNDIDINSPKSIYQYMKINDFDYLDYSNILYTFFKDGTEEIEAVGASFSKGYPKKQKHPFIYLQEGEYLSYTVPCITYDDMNSALRRFRSYIDKEGLKTTGYIYNFTDMDSLSVKEEGYYISFFVRVDL